MVPCTPGALEIGTKEFVHVYARNGTFTPEVIATTREGLTYALNTSALRAHVAAAPVSAAARWDASGTRVLLLLLLLMMMMTMVAATHLAL